MIKQIKSIFTEISIFIKEDFHLASYLYTAIFVIICITANYTFNLHDRFLAPTYSSSWSMLYFSLFYLSVYFAVAIPVMLMRREYKVLKNGMFYVKTICFIVLFGIIIGCFDYKDLLIKGLNSTENEYLVRIISFLKLTIVALPVLLLSKYFFDRHGKGLYGLLFTNKYISAYLFLFLLVFPFLAVISFTPDFMKVYPIYRYWEYEGIFGLKNWEHTAIFESVYASFYVMTELIFRGALVIGLANILGKKAILPMIALYCCIHFGKPIGETISSVFGGYILGALAYQTRHIWGGVIVHISIALSMELIGFIHYYLGISLAQQ